jgi:hypothetical protein
MELRLRSGSSTTVNMGLPHFLTVTMKRSFLIQLFKLTIIIAIVFKSIQLLVRLYNIVILNLIISGNDKYRTRLKFVAEELKIENIAGYIITICLLVLLSTWFYLTYRQAHRQSNLHLSYKPIWALFSFIIPIFNLFAPYRIMNDLWTVYNRDMSLENWGRNQIKIWWFLSIGLFVFSRYIAIRFNGASGLQSYLSFEYFSLVLFAITIHYFLLLLKLVKLISG